MRRNIVIAHTSDVHVDDIRTNGGHDGGASNLQRIIATAIGNAADVLLLAGDTFENHRLAHGLIERTVVMMQQAALDIVILPGNHDPVVADAVYHHPAFAAAANVHVLGVSASEAVVFPHLELEVWGRPHRGYGDMDPLTDPRPRSTQWQVAIAHGHYIPAPDRSSRLRPSWLIGDAEIEATGADYVALGHWNRRIAVGSGEVPAHYSGSPDYAGSINIVRLGEEKRASVEPAPLAPAIE